MAVSPTVLNRGHSVLYTWVLTSADFVANPTPPIAYRTSKSVFCEGGADAAGFNGATAQWQGCLDEDATQTFRLLNTIPDTTDLSFTATATKFFVILPDCNLVKPVFSAGAPGATGVKFWLLATSALPRH